MVALSSTKWQISKTYHIYFHLRRNFSLFARTFMSFINLFIIIFNLCSLEPRSVKSSRRNAATLWHERPEATHH